MKINNEETLQIEEIGAIPEVKSTIADKDLGLALTMVSKNLYSDPIGSFIRELTSNAVDANVDANIDEPVLIKIYKETDDDIDSYYIEFRDNGTGMSEETFKDIYMSWFNSDKRDNNDKMGGWGLGSKSPLAYVSHFEIITRYNGIKYEYSLTNEGVNPTAKLLNKSETEEPNGTTVKVAIANEDDVYKVNQAAERQLAYFNNVYVRDEIYYYDNNFKIYNKGKWQIRTGKRPFSTMHICLGQVAYPINWEVLDIEPIRVPVALNFNVGDLPVTLSREEINYTDATKELIKSRIQEMEDEIQSMYADCLSTDNFFEFYGFVRDRNRPPLTIEDITIPMTGYKGRSKFNRFPQLRLKGGGAATAVFAGFKVNEIANGKIVRKRNLMDKTAYGRYFESTLGYNDTIYFNDKEKSISGHDLRYIGQADIIKADKKLSRKAFLIYALLLDQIESCKGSFTGSDVKPSIILTDSSLVSAREYRFVLKIGAAKVINAFFNHLKATFAKRFKEPSGICPPEVIAEERARQRESRILNSQSITYYTPSGRGKITFGVLQKLDYVFYANTDISKKFKFFMDYLFSSLPSHFKKRAIVMMVAPSNINRLKKLDNSMPVEKMLTLKDYAFHFSKFQLQETFFELVEKYEKVFCYSKFYSDKYDRLFKFFNERGIDAMPKVSYEAGNYRANRNYYNSTRMKIREVIPSLFELPLTDKDLEIKREIEELAEVVSKLKILHYLINETPSNLVAEVITEAKVLKMNKQYYKTK
jgi:hypothetical protein